MKHEFNLSESVCVIVGGAGLLGSAFAKAAAKSGAHVVIADVDKKKGTRLAAELGGAFEYLDITKSTAIANAAKRIQKKFKTIDGVVIASYPRTKGYGAHPDKVSQKDFNDFLSYHVGGYFLCARTFVPLMKKGGSIVFLGSMYGTAAPKFDIYKGTTMTMPVEYAAAKGAIVQLARYLAVLHGPKNIRVNTVSPGGIFNGHSKKFVQAYGKYTKVGSGMLSADDISGTILYLLSDAAKKVTGQNIVVDAGWTL